MYLHAWDLADDSVDATLEWIRRADLNTLNLAATYHHGWFLHPRHGQHRAFMTEGDVCYFHPDPSSYRETKLKPLVSRTAGTRDCLAEVAKRLGPDLRLVSWTVGAHNTRLGLAHPECAVRNVYGDRLPHALCPANNDVKEYLKALCRDLATHYPLWGIQLEAFCWMGLAHGHHHERDLVGLSPVEQDLMGLCVCPDCEQKAGRAGVDVSEVRVSAKDILDAAFREAPARPPSHPRSMAEAEAVIPELGAFRRWQQTYIKSLLTEIRKESLAGSSCRLLLQTGFDTTLAGVVDGFACASYHETAAATLRICEEASRSVRGEWDGLMQCLIQLGMGIPESEEDLGRIIAAARDGGCNGVSFYNFSESPPKMLEWLGRTLPAFSP